jgi:mycothiol synthase
VISIDRVESAPQSLTEVRDLLDRVERYDGHSALDEHAWLDLVHGGRPGYAGFVARDPEHGHVVGYAHLSRHDDTRPHQWGLEIAVDPEHRGVGVELALAKTALAAAVDDGGGHLHLWVFRPTEIHEALAHRLGLQRGRELVQMRRSLPTGMAPTWPDGVAVRAFVPGRDEDAWLAVNNRAFGAHPEQGGWDRPTLERREKEPWFDPAGFLIAESEGAMAGFCWTKIHPNGLGEIYVIGVDPDHQGTGLGRALVLAGLGSLAAQGVSTAMLYVDAENTTAVGLYDALGFTVDHTDRAYVKDF